MIAQEVAKKYAAALFRAARERQLVDQAYEQMGELQKLLAMNRDLISFLTAPQIAERNKQEVIRAVFGGRLEPLFVEFLLVLLRKRRVLFLRDIIDRFIELVEAEKGFLRVTATSVVALNDAERRKLIDRLEKRSGLKVLLEEKVDPEVVGGLVVVLHNQIVDGSIRHGLDLVRQQLVNLRVH